MRKTTTFNTDSGENRPEKGHLFIISAPSGAGKTTLCRALRERIPQLRYSISYTTRPPRPGEQHGVDYYFISIDEFKHRMASRLWAEWAEVYGNYYGTEAEFLAQSIAEGHDVLLDIDVQGAAQIVNRFPDSVTIFVMPPSMEVLRQRLTARGTASAEDTQRRLESAAAEIARKDQYRHVIINDELAPTVSELTNLVGDYCKGVMGAAAPGRTEPAGPA